MVNVEVLSNNFYTNMEDCPYEIKKPNKKIYIKPILVKDYLKYEWAREVLGFDKNKINDIEVISMSYLTFLKERICTEDFQKGEFISKLWWIFKLSLDEEYWSFGDNCILFCEEDSTIKYVINAKEFDDISKIIRSYNDIDYSEREVSDEVKELAKTYYSTKYKDSYTPTLEEKKAFVSSHTNKTFKELNELTIREFELLYRSCLNSEQFFAEKIIQASYKYDVKENVIHPLFRKKEDPYEELFTSTQTLSNKGIVGAENIGQGLG